jgi:hypothetical protein
MYTQKAGLSLVATPPKISHAGRHCVRWHAVVCYGAPEWFRLVPHLKLRCLVQATLDASLPTPFSAAPIIRRPV